MSKCFMFCKEYTRYSPKLALISFSPLFLCYIPDIVLYLWTYQSNSRFNSVLHISTTQCTPCTSCCSSNLSSSWIRITPFSCQSYFHNKKTLRTILNIRVHLCKDLNTGKEGKPYRSIIWMYLGIVSLVKNYPCSN